MCSNIRFLNKSDAGVLGSVPFSREVFFFVSTTARFVRCLCGAVLVVPPPENGAGAVRSQLNIFFGRIGAEAPQFR